MKKTLILVLAICLLALGLSGCYSVAQDAGAQQGSSTASMLAATLPMIIILVVMYLVMVIPDRKRKKAAQQMRDSVEVGDKITTIGGMVGRVVHVGPERITFETGEDRVRIEINKWAISVNEGKGANKETVSSDEYIGS